MNNNIVSMRDKNGVETRLADNLSLYEAYSLVMDKRGLKDGNFYWIGVTLKEKYPLFKFIK